MSDENAGTNEQASEAQQPQATGTPDLASEVTTLRSRNAGLDAKVSSLLAEQKALSDQLSSFKAELDKAQKGLLDKDETLSAQLKAKDEELTKVRTEAALVRIEKAYPETFAVFGEATINMSPDQLAAAEARFKGVADSGAEEEPQAPAKPVGNAGRREVGKREPASWEEEKQGLINSLGGAFRGIVGFDPDA